MKSISTAIRAPLIVVGSASLIALGGCGEGERAAEADTPVSEAEVRTELPEGAVSDEQLQTAADAAANMAASPTPEVIPVPVPVPVGNGAAGAGNATAGNAAATNKIGQ